MTARDDLNAKTEEAHKLLARCRTEGRALLERAASPGPARDGYPRTASGADPTAPSQPLYAPQSDDADGRAISYSDPTGDAAGGHTRPDPVKQDARRFWNHILKALDHLDRAGAVLDLQQHVLGQAVVGHDEDRYCQSCRRDGGYPELVAEGRYARYCLWCGEFVAEHRAEPPLRILEDRHLGKRIYDRDVQREMAAEKARGKQQRKAG